MAESTDMSVDVTDLPFSLPEVASDPEAVQECALLSAEYGRLIAEVSAIDPEVLDIDPLTANPAELALLSSASAVMSGVESLLERVYGIRSEVKSRQEYFSHQIADARRTIDQTRQRENNEVRAAAAEGQRKISESLAKLTAAREQILSRIAERDPAAESDLRMVDAAITNARIGLMTMEHTVAAADANREIDDFELASTEMLDVLWRGFAHHWSVLVAQQRRRSARRSRARDLRFFAYALVIVAAGVAMDAVVATTALAWVGTSLTLAVAAWAVDRWMLTPRLRRTEGARRTKELVARLTVCLNMLISIRAMQATMSAVASAVGLPPSRLLDPFVFEPRAFLRQVRLTED